ncbi:MAG: hypothetical protein EXS36_08980 [Pedosphaera sp.]|nr:hypothetical protein [Pedosphaera sp.]
MNINLTILLAAAVLCATARAETKPLFSQDFSKVSGTEVPDEFLVLDGQFAVKEEGGNRFLELPGSPLDTFGVMFGPNESAGVRVGARIFAMKQGRKFPTFEVGLGGVGGFKLRIAPAKKLVELLKGDDVRATAPFEWKTGEWTNLRLQVRMISDGLKIEGRAWQEGDEPREWLITATEKGKGPGGKAGVWGMPFAGTPIRFDDLTVTAVE